MNSMLAVAPGAGEYAVGTVVLLAVVLVGFVLWECWGCASEAWTKGKWKSFLALVRVALKLVGIYVVGCALLSYTKPQLQVLLDAVSNATAQAESAPAGK